MNLRIPLSIIVPLLLAGLLAVLACASDPGDKLAGLGANMGILEGTVHFVGVPCPLTYPQRPPCDGPYPDYEVVVYGRRGETAVARTRTDDDGFYRVDLRAGEYVIFTQNGMNELFTEIHEFTIAARKITVLHLTVDTGVR